MAPKKETPEQKAQRLTAKGDTILSKAAFQECIASMRGRPEVVNSVKQHLIAKGYFLQSQSAGIPASMPDVQVQTEVPTPMEARALADAIEASKVHQPELFRDPLLQVDLHRNYSCLRMTPPKYLKLVAQHMEPVALHTRMLTVLCKPGQREVPKEEVLEIIEFCTDKDPNTPFTFLHLALVAYDCVQKNFELGRRANQLRLPPDWSKDGFYMMKWEGTTLLVWLRWEPSRVAEVQFPGVSETMSDSYFITANFSFFRARLKARHDSQVDVLIHVLLGRVQHARSGPSPPVFRSTSAAALEDVRTRRSAKSPGVACASKKAGEVPAAQGTTPPVGRSSRSGGGASSAGVNTTDISSPAAKRKTSSASHEAADVQKKKKRGGMDEKNFVPPKPPLGRSCDLVVVGRELA